MKVQDVKKECLATVGLTVEFSNSEISSLSSLLRDVTDVVNKAIEEAHTTAVATSEQYDEHDKINATIDLKSLKRVEWLLIQLTRRDMSGLFEQADADYRAELSYINDVPAVKEEHETLIKGGPGAWPEGPIAGESKNF